MEAPWTITSAARALRDGSITSVELVRMGFAQADRLDSDLVTYIARFDESAQEGAALADQELARGQDKGPLHGIPIGIKDVILTREGPTTANSLVRNPAWTTRRDATVIRKLREAGAILTGKLSTMEFAFGAVDADGPFRLPRTPWDPNCWAGGSSSGSGNGVASNMFLGALGSDTAGSVRMPAAYCGITGLKQTYGLVSNDGLIPLSPSLDYIGPMARSAADTALILQAIAGWDESDPTSLDVGDMDFSAAVGQPLSGLRIGVERKHHFSGDDVDPTLADRFDEAVEVLQAAGASVREVELPYYSEVVDAVFITILGDAMAYHRELLREQWDAYQRATRVGFAGGIFFTAGDYAQAQKVRRAARRLVMKIFRDIDLMVMPTTATAPWQVSSESDVEQIEVARVMASIYTCYWNPIGNPVISVPMGFNGDGLPLGLQIAGRPLEEATVIGAADAFQRVTDWHLRVAPIVRAAD